MKWLTHLESMGAIWRSPSDGRQGLLAMYLVAVGLASLAFYLMPTGQYDRHANLLVCLLVLVVLPLAWVRSWFVPLVHFVSLLSLVLVAYVAAFSGGINSPALVWLTLLAVPVLLLLGPQAGGGWMALVFATLLALWLATRSGALPSQVDNSQPAIFWAYLNQVLALGNLMLAACLYDYLHERQLKRLKARNQEIQNMHQAMLLAQAHKDEFVAAVGHELRTPMNAILGFNGVLRQELADNPAQVEVVDHIRRSTAHLLQVVNDILDFSQLQAGQLTLHTEDFDLQALLDDAMAPEREKALDKGITMTASLDPGLPAWVHADRQRLVQILRNLLSNALKFSTHGEVHLRIHGEQGRLNFEVSDNGRGVAPELQTQIFKRFEQTGDQTTRGEGGTGLGLSICEKLVALQGGEIGVRSQPGLGATFWFHVPLLAAAAKVMANPGRAAPLPDMALRILVVDDNAMNLMVARLQLQRCWPQAHIVTLDTAAQALVVLAQESFDLALVDMVMPNMDGLALTRQIHQQFPGIAAQMPIIALTANTNPVDRQRCLEAGMCDVLDKPMDVQRLESCVQRQLLKVRG